MTLWEKFYMWSLNTGRYIIIGTEIVVLACFFYKFKLDNDLATVKSDLDQNISVLQAHYSEVTEIRTYQNQIAAQTGIIAHQVKIHDLLAHTLSLIPGSISVSNIRMLTSTSIVIRGSVAGTSNTQLTTIQGFANTLRADNAYKNVSLTSVSTVPANNLTTFLITMNINTM